MFKVELKVMPRKGVLNPASAAVTRSLKALGYDQVTKLEMGKFMEFTVDMADRDAVESYVQEMCKRLLANPVIEDYTYEIFPVEGE